MDENILSLMRTLLMLQGGLSTEAVDKALEGNGFRVYVSHGILEVDRIKE